MDDVVLNVHQLSVNYDRTPVLWDLSFSLPKGKLVAILGPNGAGKSTLLKAMLGLIRPFSGEVAFFGAPLRKVRQRIAYVPQRESVDWDFPITVSELVLMGRYGRLGLFRRPSRQDRREVGHYLEKVGLDAYGHRQISQLSGGQQQRAFLARALMQEADLYFMDEPFAGVDLTTTQALIGLMKGLREEGKTLLVVHHDLASVSEIFDWVLLLNLCLIGCGTVASCFTPPLLQKTYGKETGIFHEAAHHFREKQRGSLLS